MNELFKDLTSGFVLLAETSYKFFASGDVFVVALYVAPLLAALIAREVSFLMLYPVGVGIMILRDIGRWRRQDLEKKEKNGYE